MPENHKTKTEETADPVKPWENGETSSDKRENDIHVFRKVFPSLTENLPEGKTVRFLTLPGSWPAWEEMVLRYVDWGERPLEFHMLEKDGETWKDLRKNTEVLARGHKFAAWFDSLRQTFEKGPTEYTGSLPVPDVTYDPKLGPETTTSFLRRTAHHIEPFDVIYMDYCGGWENNTLFRDVEIILENNLLNSGGLLGLTHTVQRLSEERIEREIGLSGDDLPMGRGFRGSARARKAAEKTAGKLAGMSEGKLSAKHTSWYRGGSYGPGSTPMSVVWMSADPGSGKGGVSDG